MRILLVALFLAGCAQAPGPLPDLTSDPAVQTECLLAKPDGASACVGGDFVPAVSAGRPSVLDGWKCTNSWEDGGNRADLYTTADGRVGMYWEWQRWKDDGLPFQRLAWYDTSGGQVLHVPFQETGFVALPAQDPEGPVEIHTTLKHLRVHAQVEGEWIHPDNVTFLVDGFGGDTWWGIRFDWPGGPYYLSTMMEAPEKGRLALWEGPGWRGTVAGVPVIIDNMGAGNKYVGVDFTARRAMTSGCSVV